MTTPIPYPPGPSCMQDATAKTYHARGMPSTLNREPYFKGRKGSPKKRASYIKPSELFWSHSQALLWTGHKTKCLCSNVETSKSGRKPNVCKSPLQKQNFFSFICKSSQSPWQAAFFYLHGAPQQVPIRLRADAAAPTVLTHPATLRLIHLKPPRGCHVSSGCPRACFPPIFHLHAASVQSAEGYTPSPSTFCTSEPWLSRIWATKTEQILWHPICILHQKLASRMSSNIFTQPFLFKSPMDCSD